MNYTYRYFVALSLLAFGSVAAAAGCVVDAPESDSLGDPASVGTQTEAIAADGQTEEVASDECAALEDEGSTQRTACALEGHSTEMESTDASGALAADQSPEEASIAAPPGKKCWATCTVINVGAGSCPVTMGGYGNTTFLGGCNKACNKAKGDAASKLLPGCVINNCSFSGC